jgi:diazepam-binding inhibitor (GABA receptor modulating acyl-CoA-binding protein)
MGVLAEERRGADVRVHVHVAKPEGAAPIWPAPFAGDWHGTSRDFMTKIIPPRICSGQHGPIPSRLSNRLQGESMSDLHQRFETAVAQSKNLPERPDNTTLLKIYALYKQATVGDAQGERPGFGDMVGRAKFDAWAALKGAAKGDAMSQYIELIDSLKD